MSERRSNLTVLHSSKSDEWGSPTHIVEASVKVLGGIDLDPCSNLGKPNVPAKKHYTIEDDGLAHEWEGRVYLNPPYGRTIQKWTSKLINSYEGGSITAAIALLPARTDTKWFQEFAPYARCFVFGRLRFVGATALAPFPSVVFYLGDNIEAFCAEFSRYGHIYGAALDVMHYEGGPGARTAEGCPGSSTSKGS